jgi:ABC-type nickel/cobalt efflux system permease component RcnA
MDVDDDEEEEEKEEQEEEHHHQQNHSHAPYLAIIIPNLFHYNCGCQQQGSLVRDNTWNVFFFNFIYFIYF